MTLMQNAFKEKKSFGIHLETTISTRKCFIIREEEIQIIIIT